MSGGSMDYLSHKLENVYFKTDTALRRTFRVHLQHVADALHAIEWNDDGDGAPNEDELIRKCLPEWFELSEAMKRAVVARDELNEAILRAQGWPG
jgi:hypothetical protein